MTRRDLLWYDVFTSQRFAGNPLAIVPDADGLDAATMAAIARELGLSETTFVLPPTLPGATHRVRIFTPGRELPFAGHPTVGTAVALTELAGRDADDLVFELAAGPTPVSVRRDGSGALVASFVAPQLPTLRPPGLSTEAVASMLGIEPDDIDPTVPLHRADSGGTEFLVVVLRSVRALAQCRAAQTPVDVVGVYVAARAGDGFRCRMFAPAAGIAEDPATGSAACSFAGSLHRHVDGFGSDGRHDIAIEQGVEMGRASELALSYDVTDGAVSEVRLAGAAVRVLTGSLDAD